MLTLLGGSVIPLFAGGMPRIGGFVGEPSGFSFVYPVGHRDVDLEMNAGWSTRRDGGVDLGALAKFSLYESKRRDPVQTYWFWGAGGHVTFFDHTEFAVLGTIGPSFVFGGGQDAMHEIYIEVGPTVALVPGAPINLFAVVGYRITG